MAGVLRPSEGFEGLPEQLPSPAPSWPVLILWVALTVPPTPAHSSAPGPSEAF